MFRPRLPAAVLALEPELLICDHAGILENAAERLARKIGW